MQLIVPNSIEGRGGMAWYVIALCGDLCIAFSVNPSIVSNALNNGYKGHDLVSLHASPRHRTISRRAQWYAW